jgi:hypothetical protein
MPVMRWATARRRSASRELSQVMHSPTACDRIFRRSAGGSPMLEA